MLFTEKLAEVWAIEAERLINPVASCAVRELFPEIAMHSDKFNKIGVLGAEGVMCQQLS